MISEIVRHGSASRFSEEQLRMIREMYAKGATDSEFFALMELANARNLNPLIKQCHFVCRFSKQSGKQWTVQVSIDGLRAIAQRTGLYAGQSTPVFEERADGSLKSCTVNVYRKDWTHPAPGVAYWDEFAQKDSNGNVTKFWRDMPRVMLSKVAESIAIRKAFPEDTSGIYTREEMMQADRAEPEIPEAIIVEKEKPSLEARLRVIRGAKEWHAITAEACALSDEREKSEALRLVTNEFVVRIRLCGDSTSIQSMLTAAEKSFAPEAWEKCAEILRATSIARTEEITKQLNDGTENANGK